LSKVIARKAAKENYNTVMDGIGDNSIENLEIKVDNLKADGHPVEAVYVTVDTDKAVERAKDRAEKTGRMSTEAILRASHKGVSTVFPAAVKEGLFDTWSLWDTNFQPPRKIAFGFGTQITVLDVAAYRKFLDKSKE